MLKYRLTTSGLYVSLIGFNPRWLEVPKERQTVKSFDVDPQKKNKIFTYTARSVVRELIPFGHLCYAELAVSSLQVAETIANPHCAYPPRDSQAELAWVAG